MLSIEDIKLLNEYLNHELGESDDIKILKEKIALVCKQINISEIANKDMTTLQDAISKLGKEDKEDEKREEK